MAEGNKTGALRALIMEAEKGVKPFFSSHSAGALAFGELLVSSFFFFLSAYNLMLSNKKTKKPGELSKYTKRLRNKEFKNLFFIFILILKIDVRLKAALSGCNMDSKMSF